MIKLLDNISANVVGDWKDPFADLAPGYAPNRSMDFTLCTSGTFGTATIKVEFGYVKADGNVAVQAVVTSPVDMSSITAATEPPVLTITEGMRVRGSVENAGGGTSGLNAVLV